ncbi:MAG TPA: N-acetylmuramoyl-L-alanine amidase [Candidatus Eisenbacteria bacterium]|nr:N-acetylmuramoyl-L-alanine amidase [Candidatus Eisenbacteria bacterium]
MILDFFGLREQPFGVTPDPAYLYPSHTHCSALDSLTDAILTDRGFLALIADPGMGKTTLLQQVLEGLRESARAVFLFQTQCDSREFFQYLMHELGVDFTGMSLVAMHNKLNDILFAEMLSGRRFVLIIDEAQNLSDSVLETIRMLSNFETTHSKLMQIILAGQPQLGEKLEQKNLAQLLQRLNVIQYLEPLPPEETLGYIHHRLKVAGYRGDSLFDDSALALIAEHGGGIPREINKVCFRSMLEGYAAGAQLISTDLVEKAVHRLRLKPVRRLKLVSKAETPVPPPPPPTVLAEVLPAEPSPKLASASPVPQFTYPATKASLLPAWTIRIGATMVIVLIGMLLVPANALPRVAALLHGTFSATRNLVRPRSANLASVAASPKPPTASRPAPSAANPSSAPPAAISTETSTASRDFQVSARPQDSPYSLAGQLGLKVNRIVIDPGHGGYDTGTAGPHGLLEKDLCLDVSLRLGRLIQQNLPGTDVIYTRSDDRHVSLEERTAIANEAGADLFISIHANSSDLQDIRGAETFYLSLASPSESRELVARENSLSDSALHNLPEIVREITSNEKLSESRRLAVDIQQSLSRQLEQVSRQEANRGVKQAPFIVLTGANMPAVLSEISFVSNATDETLLQQSTQRQRIAEGLYWGVASYLGRLPSAPFSKPNDQRQGTAFSTDPRGRAASEKVAKNTGQ